MATAVTNHPPFWGKILESGSTGPDVALVQRWLDGLRDKWTVLPKLSVDGKYGAKTAEAVKLFQALNNVKEDGKVGPVTWSDLCAAYADYHGSATIYPGIPLKSGHRGSTVKLAQEQLQGLIPGLTADGKFGENTRRAVKAHQTLHNLAIDGVVGPTTWQTLFEVNAG